MLPKRRKFLVYNSAAPTSNRRVESERSCFAAREVEQVKDARGIALSLMALVILLTAGAYGFSEELKPGVVVDTITKNLEADKAGLQPGDLIVRWTRAGVQGTIESPFDLSAIEIEQAPRGSVILEGLRGAENHSWTLGVSKWGVQARPQLPEARLRIYLQAQEMASVGKLEEAAEKWRTAAAQVKDASALWFLYQIASMWADARRWDEADKAYQQAVEAATDASPVVRTQLFSSWAVTYRNRSDWNNAEACYQRSVAEAQKLSNENLTLAKGHYDLGQIFYQRSDLEKAENYYRPIFPFLYETGDYGSGSVRTKQPTTDCMKQPTTEITGQMSRHRW